MRAEMDQLTQSLDKAAPGHGYGALVSTPLLLHDATVGPIATTMWILLASAGVVLLVACANIANLFLVRSEARQQEIAVRRALGAGSAGIAGYSSRRARCSHLRAARSVCGGVVRCAAARGVQPRRPPSAG